MNYRFELNCIWMVNYECKCGQVVIRPEYR